LKIDTASSNSSNTFFLNLLAEITLIWKFIRYDVSATIVPGTIFTLVSAISARVPATRLVVLLLIAFIHFFLFIYIFDLSNQLNSLEEDRLNKPDRPIPSGYITRKQSSYRFFLGIVIFLMVGMIANVFLQDIIWLFSLLIYNHTSLGKTWWFKNLNVSIGVWCMLSAAAHIGNSTAAYLYAWAFWTALIQFPLIAISDLRDVAGDRAIGRHTLPTLLGDRICRLYLITALLLTPLYTHFTMYVPFGINSTTLAAEIFPTLLLVIIALRIATYKTAKADHQTYILFTVWYIVHLLTAFIYTGNF
jgi:4-hydroxybenzoate polyprenyltransferase